MFQEMKGGPMLRSLPFGDRHHVGMGALSVVLSLVAMYLIIAPVWSPQLLWWRYDNARLLEMALLCSVGAMIALPSLSRALYDRWLELGRGARSLLLVFCAAGAVSAALSGAPQVGTLQLSLAVLLVGMTLTIASAVRDKAGQSESALAVAIGAGALLVVLQFWATQAADLIQDEAFAWVSPFLTFANVRFFSQYQSYALLLIVLPTALFTLGRVQSYLLYLLAANFWSLQWMVGTRAVWLGFLVAALSVAMFARGVRVRWFKQQIVGLAGGLIIFLLFTGVLMPSAEAPAIPKQHSVTERGWQSVNARVTMLHAGLNMVKEHPLLGVGPGQFGHNYSATLAAHPHNSPLQFLAEYGLIGGGAAISLLALLGIYALKVMRTASSGQKGVAGVYLAAALVMGLVDSCVSGNLTMPHSQIMFCVVAGWLLGRSQAPADPAASATVRTHVRAIRLALTGTVLLAATLGALLTIEYASAVYGMQWWLEPNPPNLWQYGRFSAW